MRRRVLVSTFLGGVIEWYDLYVYAAASALVLNSLFFPKLSPVVGTIASFGTLAIGWLARPLAGIVFGHLGDRIGRKRVLIITLVAMGLSSALIGALPTYAAAGVWAPILLTFLRVLQGVGAGGEYGAAALMVIEHAPAKRRALYGSVIAIAIFAGIILANLVFVLITQTLSQSALLAWGWRVPFFASILLLLVTMYLRARIAESPLFERAQARESEQIAARTTNRWPLLALLRAQPGSALIGLVLMLGPSAVSQVYGPIFNSYALQIGYTRSSVLWLGTIATVFGIAGALFWAWLGDRIGRRPVLFFSTIVPPLLLFAAFPLFDTTQFWLALVGLVLLYLSQSGALAVIPVALAELFTTTQRNSGVSFTYQVSVALGAGFSPLLANSILLWAGGPPNTFWVTMFFIAISVPGVIALLALRENPNRSLDDVGSAPAGSSTLKGDSSGVRP